VTSPRIELLPERPYFKGLHLVKPKCVDDL